MSAGRNPNSKTKDRKHQQRRARVKREAVYQAQKARKRKAKAH